MIKKYFNYSVFKIINFTIVKMTYIRLSIICKDTLNYSRQHIFYNFGTHIYLN